jgi:hypothetical protein
LRVHDTEAISFDDLASRTAVKTKRGDLAVEKGPNGKSHHQKSLTLSVTLIKSNLEILSFG